MTVVDVTQDEDGGYSATFGIGVDLSAPTQAQTGGPVNEGGFPGRMPPGGTTPAQPPSGSA